MIKHIVFFKLVDNSEEKCNELASKLRPLKNEISEIIDYEVGINFAQSERAYDISLISSFASEEDMEIYAKHPKHIDFIAYAQEIGAQTKVVDYKL